MSNNLNIPDFGEVPEFPVITIDNEAWHDGLVVRVPNWLGDAVMAIPALMQLSRIVPENCGVFVVVPPGLKELYGALDFVDKVIPLHKAHSAWSRDDLYKVSHLRAGIGHLQNNSLRDAYYFKRAGIPRLYGAAKRGRSILLHRSFKFPKIKDKKLNYLHHAGRYLSMAYAMGAPEWKGELPVFNQAKEPEIMSCEVRKILESGKLLVVAPGAAYGEAKRWPSENFRDVCRRWIDNGGDVAIIGTAGEKEVAANVAEGLNSEKVANLAGETDMSDLIEILKHADQCVANDSGVMHLSAILGGKGIALFGSTDPSSTSPVSTKWKILFKQLECAPCFKRECPLGHYNCLKSITPEMVWSAITNS
jgi:heptosyltransferase-2